jgi:hypothetical protein
VNTAQHNKVVKKVYEEAMNNMPAMLKRLNITMDRGLYTALKEQ